MEINYTPKNLANKFKWIILKKENPIKKLNNLLQRCITFQNISDIVYYETKVTEHNEFHNTSYYTPFEFVLKYYFDKDEINKIVKELDSHDYSESQTPLYYLTEKDDESVLKLNKN